VDLGREVVGGQKMIRWIVFPPDALERPKPCLGVPLLRPLPDDGRELRCCRSSGPHPARSDFRSALPGSAPTDRPLSAPELAINR